MNSEERLVLPEEVAEALLEVRKAHDTLNDVFDFFNNRYPDIIRDMRERFPEASLKELVHMIINRETCVAKKKPFPTCPFVYTAWLKEYFAYRDGLKSAERESSVYVKTCDALIEFIRTLGIF